MDLLVIFMVLLFNVVIIIVFDNSSISGSIFFGFNSSGEFTLVD